MREMTPDDWGIKELQNCILNIAKYIHDFCMQYGVEYTIAGGTTLGAVRHKGFIPWDDDMDLFMTPNNYEKFRKIFKEKGDHSKYYLQEGFSFNGMVNWAKIRLNNSTFIEEAVANKDIHHGVYVDIFLIHNSPKSKIKQIWMLFWGNYISFKEIINRNYNKRGRMFNIFLRAFRFLPSDFLVKFALQQIYRYRYKECDFKCNVYDRKPLKQLFYPNYYFDNVKPVEFEKVSLMCMGDPDSYLKACYGNYMEMPSLSQIKYKKHAMEWSVDKPFTPRGKGLFLDE